MTSRDVIRRAAARLIMKSKEIGGIGSRHLLQELEGAERSRVSGGTDQMVAGVTGGDHVRGCGRRRTAAAATKARGEREDAHPG